MTLPDWLPAFATPRASEDTFNVIAADPAWRFGDKLPGEGRGAEKHYDVMSVQAICDLVSVGEDGRLYVTMCQHRFAIAENAHLFLWRVSAMQQEALDVVRSWGFTVKSELVWCKRTKNGLEHFGMGRHVRLAHEICLIATRGKGAGIVNRSQRSTFDTEVELTPEELASLYEVGDGIFEAPVGRHSKKPDAFYGIVEGLFAPDARRLELFAREARPGWTCSGNEL